MSSGTGIGITYQTYKERSQAPATPTATYDRLFFKSDGLHYINSLGIDIFIGSDPLSLTKLAITGSISASTTFSVTSSGVNYTKSGDDGYLEASEATFNATDHIEFFLNGVYQEKGVHATWISTTSFRLDVAVDNGDELTILS